MHAVKDAARLAVEIAMHSRPSRECQNIRKCLKAGYDRVLALFLEPALLQDTRRLFTSDAPAEERRRVVFLELGKLGEGLF